MELEPLPIAAHSDSFDDVTTGVRVCIEEPGGDGKQQGVVVDAAGEAEVTVLVPERERVPTEETRSGSVDRPPRPVGVQRPGRQRGDNFEADAGYGVPLGPVRKLRRKRISDAEKLLSLVDQAT